MTKMAAMPTYGKNPLKVFPRTKSSVPLLVRRMKVYSDGFGLVIKMASLFRWFWSRDQDGHNAHVSPGPSCSKHR